jgi:hypothetical protein
MSAAAFLKRAVAGVAVAAVAATCAVVTTPGAAHAGGYRTVRIAPRSNALLFVDVSGASTASLARIIQWPVTGDNQVWALKPIGSNYELVNAHSNKCLETDGIPGDQLFQAPCDGNPGELWYYQKSQDDSGAVLIQNPASGLYLDVYGGSTTQGGAIDAWYFNGYNYDHYPYIQGPVNQEFYLLDA